MEPHKVERRLAAILAADVVGYSRLMEKNETATLALLNDHRRQLIAPAIAEHNGRIVKTTGDGMLAEFASVVDAVRCAIGIQHAMRERNADTPVDERIQFRIGINLGDIMVEGDDIYGDGVNVAARLEALGEPGGLCISGTVYEHIRNKLGLVCDDLGAQKVKNISHAVRVYRVRMDASVGETAVRRVGARRWTWAAAAILAIVVAGGGIWSTAFRGSEPAVTAVPVDRETIPMPTGPSLAVMPFANMSDNTQQDYFADGITEDLITDLSRISSLFVIARNVIFAYKSRDVSPQQVADELKVRYVLNGSVRRDGEEVRINVQLVDAATGGLLWATRYDGAVTDVFALQDKVTLNIVTALATELPAMEQARLGARETLDPAAYDAFLRGWAHYRNGTPEDFAKAIPNLERAVELDNDFCRAHAALAAIYWQSWRRGWTDQLGIPADELARRAEAHLKEAKRIPTPLAHQVASLVLSYQGQHEEALAEAQRAIVLDANDPSGYEVMTAAQRAAGNASTGAYP